MTSPHTSAAPTKLRLALALALAAGFPWHTTAAPETDLEQSFLAPPAAASAVWPTPHISAMNMNSQSRRQSVSPLATRSSPNSTGGQL